MIVAIGDSSCAVVNSSFESAWCVIEEGVGKDQSVSLAVDGQQSAIDDEMGLPIGPDSLDDGGFMNLFRYPAPSDHFLVTSDPPNCRRKCVDIRGENFGSNRTTSRLRVYFLTGDPRRDITLEYDSSTLSSLFDFHHAHGNQDSLPQREREKAVKSWSKWVGSTAKCRTQVGHWHRSSALSPLISHLFHPLSGPHRVVKTGHWRSEQLVKEAGWRFSTAHCQPPSTICSPLQPLVHD